MDDDPFSGWGLQTVEAGDRATLTPYFACLDHPLSDYTFSQVFTWRNSLRILWTTLHGHLCVFANGAGDLTLLMPPIGDGDSPKALATAFELMDDYNAAHGVPERSRVEYASEELLARCGNHGLLVAPMGTDYVYDVNRMIDLAGGDLSSKRQAKNRFLRNYEHRVEAYDAARHVEDCRQLLDSWKNRQDAHHSEETESSAAKRRKETVATDLALTCASELAMRGLVVYVKQNNDWSLRGFTFGELLGRDQSSITIEKTDLEIKGLAQFIFSEFCRQCWADRPLVNVGDDWGMETLAWTKMSYRPVKMLRKYALRRIAAAKVAVPAMPAVFTPEIRKPAPNLVIRPALKNDIQHAVELEKACFSSYSLNERQLQYLRQRQSAVFLVAEQDGQIAGEGIALIRQHKRRGRITLSGRIYSLAVKPELRGHGIGHRLLAAMIESLANRGVRRIYLEVERNNRAAIGLYDRCGFRNIGELPDYYGPGQPAMHMLCQAPVTPGLFDPPPLVYNISCA